MRASILKAHAYPLATAGCIAKVGTCLKIIVPAKAQQVGLVESLHQHLTSFRQIFGREPDILYLGRDEYQLLRRESVLWGRGVAGINAKGMTYSGIPVELLESKDKHINFAFDQTDLLRQMADSYTDLCSRIISAAPTRKTLPAPAGSAGSAGSAGKDTAAGTDTK